MATPRKRKPSKRKTKQKRRRRPSLLLIAGIAALVAGFLVRRSLIPSAMYRLTHRAPDHQSAPVNLNEPETGGLPQNEASREVPAKHDETRASRGMPMIEEKHKSAERTNPGVEHAPTMTSKIDTPAKSSGTNPVAAPGDAVGPSEPPRNVEGEHISTSDRHQLDSILKKKAN